MSGRFFLAAAAVVPVQVNGQASNRLGKNPNAGVDCRHLHGGAFRYSFAGGRAAEEEAVGASAGRVLGLIPAPK